MADQTGAADSFSETSDPSALEFVTERVMNRRGVMTLAKIVRAPYDAQDQNIATGATGAVGYVDVLPLVNQLDGSGNAVPHGNVFQLPYTRYQGGANAVINDPVIGDIGMIFIAHEDISSVKSTGGQANPGSRRRGAYEDGIFLGVVNGGANPSQYITFTEGGISIADKNGNKIDMNSNGIKFTTAQASFTDKILNYNNVDIARHIHEDPQGGVVGQPQNP
jgi:hypothetical protein